MKLLINATPTFILSSDKYPAPAFTGDPEFMSTNVKYPLLQKQLLVLRRRRRWQLQ